MSKLLQVIDRWARPLILLSVILYLVEEEWSCHAGWNNSYESPFYFLWAERLIASFLTLEVIVRWWRSNPWYYGAPDTSYPFNIWGIIDLIAIIPFWVGFFVPYAALEVIRTLRILRLLKFFRYSRSLQLTALKFYRAYHNLKGIAFSVGIIWLFFAVVCLKLEQNAQKEAFGSLMNTAWFTIVTGTTVGYGDMSPVTIWGKIFVGLMLVPIIGTVGMAISAFNNAFDRVQSLEDDPTVDPIEEFKKEIERVRRIRKADDEYQMEE